MAPRNVDVLILGAGGGGYPAAFLLDKAGLRVAMADPIGNLGGDCLAEGCVPSKALREVALMRARAERYPAFGLTGPPPGADWTGVLAHKDSVQQRRYNQHSDQLRASRVAFHAGHGRITGEHEVEVAAADGAHRYEFRHLILATGSRPRRLKITGSELAITSHELFRLGADLPFPQQLAVIGGGYIGVEVASMLSNLGVAATILEYTRQLLPGFDPELASFLQSNLGEQVRVELGAEVTAIEEVPAGRQVHYRQDGQERRLRADATLMATGRESVLPEGIEALGLRARGPLAVDNQLRTENPNVYAPGDVNGRNMLFHSAVRQSLVAAHNILAGGQPLERMDFGSVPAAVFTQPEIASVGLTEDQARDRYGSAEVARHSLAASARAQMLEETEGFIKLVFEPGTGCLVGAQAAGLDAAQLIAPLALAVQQRLGAGALAEAAFPHPMVSEGINEAARLFVP